MIKYKFSNKTMFAIVMRDEAVCKEFIERLFPERKVREIHFAEPEPELTADGQIISNSLGKLLSANVETEKSIINGITAKSVRLDVIFEDSDSIYDIEMQVASEKYMPQRTRYYHSSMTLHSLKAGESYQKLKQSYVIFICLYDVFGLGEPLYNFEMIDEKLGLHLNDGGYTIIVNTKCPKEKIPQGLEGFFAYLDTGEVDENDQLVCKINESVEKANYEQEVESVMTLEEEIKIQREYGVEEGLERGRNEGVASEKRKIAKNMKALKISLDNIAQATGLPLAEIEAL